MKYPSIFIAVACSWIAVIIIAVSYRDPHLTLQLYQLVIAFSLIIFLIGFWRNK